MKKKTLKKAKFGPLRTPLPPIFGGSSTDSPLKIWDLMTPHLKTFFEQKKTEN